MRPRIVVWGLSLLVGCYSGAEDFDPAGVDGDGGADAADDGDDGPEELEVAPARMRRLTRAQFVQSVRDLLAIPQWVPQTDLPDEGVNEEEFQLPNMVAGAVTTNSVGYNRYRTAAKEAAAFAFATDQDVAQRLGCQPTVPDDACVVEYLALTTERAFGRAVPQDDRVLQGLLAIVADGTERLGEVRLGLQWAVTSLIQSPELLYFYPVGDGEGGMDAYSRARSLSLMFRDSVPDAELLGHARDGSLHDPQVLDAQIDRLIVEMLQDPTQRGAVQRFFDEWWSMTVVESVGKNPDLFPEFDASLRSAMKQEVHLWLQDIVFERRLDFRSVLVSDRLYANDRLAQLYGLPGEFGDELVPVDIDPDSPRSGLLSTAAYLSVMAHPALTSPAARGRFVSERLLCIIIPPPLPDVDTTIPPPTSPETKRERFVRHTTDATCRACHELMDPSGLSLEEFDAIGRYRREETVEFEGETYQLPLDTTGELFGETFSNSKQMAGVIADSPELASCVTRQLLRHQLGRELSAGESVAVDDLEQRFIDSGMDFIELMREVARHEVFNTLTEAE